ncbi:MAG: hypothetical protein MJ009_00650 [Paludibacteraceae bacterium]|nr:hypothetical protein [Paludibacteraceae bacterium]
MESVYIVIMIIMSLIALVAIIRALVLSEQLEEANEMITRLLCDITNLRKRNGIEDNKD